MQIDDGVRSQASDDIMKTLLAHEKKASAPHIPTAAVPGPAPASDEDTSTSESDNELTAALKSTFMPSSSFVSAAGMWIILYLKTNFFSQGKFSYVQFQQECLSGIGHKRF